MAFLRNYGDLTEGRVGCGRAEYDVPLADGAFRYAAVAEDNIACRQDDQRGPAMHLKDPPKSGYVEIDMPTSYVYLTGQIELDAAVAEGGSVRLLLSDNNGLDWARSPRSRSPAGRRSTSGSSSFAATITASASF